MTIEGTTALVTGGSRGLGAALGELLAERGAKVVLVARGEAELARTVAAIRAKAKTEHVHGLAFDVGSKEAAHRIAGAAQALVGPIDLLVQNASVLGPTPLRPLLDTECEDFAAVLETNLLGPFRLAKILGGAMALRGRGTIVHVSSDAAVSAYPGWGAYGVSKAALDHLAKSFGVELAAHGVRVLSVDPGEMDTAMHAAAVPDADPSALARPRDVAERLVRLLEQPKPGDRFVLEAA
jgi:NAD(P)-dependent dehydrogenase (short-subunit alcohol dehydrogenase family)